MKYLVFFVLIATYFALAGCIHRDCPADSKAQDAVSARITAQFLCHEKDQVAATVNAIAAWKCTVRDEFAKTLPPGYSDARADCEMLVMQMKTVLAMGTPSEWMCTDGTVENLEDACVTL